MPTTQQVNDIKNYVASGGDPSKALIRLKNLYKGNYGAEYKRLRNELQLSPEDIRRKQVSGENINIGTAAISQIEKNKAKISAQEEYDVKVTEAKASARDNLRPVGTKSSIKKTIEINTPKNAKEEIINLKLSQNIPITTSLQRSSGATYILDRQTTFMENAKKARENLGLGFNYLGEKGEIRAFTPDLSELGVVRTRKINFGEVQRNDKGEFYFSKPLSKEKGVGFIPTEREYFGFIKTPTIQVAKEQRYLLDIKRERLEQAYLKENKKDIPLLSKSYRQAIGVELKAIPVRLIEKPVETGVIIGAIALTKNPEAGGLFSTAELAGALSASSLAISSIKEQQSGGTGVKTAALGLFIGGSYLASYGISKGLSSLKKTNIRYDLEIYEKGSYKGTNVAGNLKAQQTIIGKTSQGSILKGKPYNEVFINKGDTTFRQILTRQGNIKQIIETPGQQAISYYKPTSSGLKLIGEDFRYIDIGNSIKASISTQFQGRNLLAQVERPTSSTITFKEISKGSFKNTISSGRKTTSTEINIKDVFERKLLATDQIVKSRTYLGGGYSSNKGAFGEIIGSDTSYNKVRFVFDKQPIPLKDVNLIESSSGVLKEISVTQPRVYEKGTFFRQGTGSITIKESPLKLSLPQLNKKGSLYTNTVLKTEPIFSITPKTTTPFTSSISLSQVKTFSLGSSILTGSAISSVFSTKSEQNIKSSVTPIQKIKTNIRSDIRADARINTDTSQNIRSDIKIGQKINTVQNIKPDIRTSTTNIFSGIGTSTGISKIDLKIGSDFTGGGGSPKIPPIQLPKFSLGGGSGRRKKSGSVKSKTKYRPSLEAVVFDVRGSLPKEITPFSIRPIVGKRAKKPKKTKTKQRK